MTLYTVASDHLISQAVQIERDAEQSLQAWILTSQSERYSLELSKARALRSAAAQRLPSVRREILRNSGFIVKTPKQA